jgi:hypothetical protein
MNGIFLYDLIPTVSGFEYDLNHFAHGAVSTGRGGDVVGRGFRLLAGVGHGESHSDRAEQAHINDVVSHVTGLEGLKAGYFHDFAGRFYFAAGLLVEEIDF